MPGLKPRPHMDWDKIDRLERHHAPGSGGRRGPLANSPSSSIRPTTSPSSRRGRVRSESRARRRAGRHAHRRGNAGASVCHPRDSRRRLRAAVRTANRHLTRHRRRRPDHRREHEQRRAGRARSAGRPAHAGAALSCDVRAADLARISAQGRTRRDAQLPAHRPDQHVREPRVAADRDARRVHAPQPREASPTSTASSRFRTTRDAAARTARTST